MRDDIREFVKAHGEPKVVVATTIVDGHFVLIRPIPTICGPEIICASDMRGQVMEEVRAARSKP